jgi:hypothetical protein
MVTPSTRSSDSSPPCDVPLLLFPTFPDGAVEVLPGQSPSTLKAREWMRGGVDRPRTVGAVDEKRQPGAAVTAEVGERAHHLRAGAVVNGQRQLIPIPGKPGKHAGWWSVGRETTRRRATGRRESADRNAAQQRTAIYLPHISTLLLGAFPRKRPAFVVCLDFRLGATGPTGSHHRERQRSSRLEPGPSLKRCNSRSLGYSVNALQQCPSIVGGIRLMR